MNIYEKFEFLQNNGWEYVEREYSAMPYAFKCKENGSLYSAMDLEQLIDALYKRCCCGNFAKITYKK